MNKLFTCSYCEEVIEYTSPSTNKSYCKEHLETEFFNYKRQTIKEV